MFSTVFGIRLIVICVAKSRSSPIIRPPKIFRSTLSQNIVLTKKDHQGSLNVNLSHPAQASTVNMYVCSIKLNCLILLTRQTKDKGSDITESLIFLRTRTILFEAGRRGFREALLATT